MQAAIMVEGREDRLLDADPREFREKFDRHCFEFAHRLAGHPAFELPRLVEMAQRLSTRPDEVYVDTGEVRVDQRWDQVPKTALPVAEVIKRIEESKAWIIIRRAEQEPEFRVLLERCMAEIGELAGLDLQRLMMVQNAIIFVSSPGRVTSYHIDRECNCILQIRGRKEISIFDREDREVLTEEELERYWAVDNNAALYKEQLQSRATVVQLAPGKAVHVPVTSPHWVKNGPEVSITLSANFQYRDTCRADVYRANYYLRRLGLDPRPPGTSALRDAFKRGALHGMQPLLDLRRRAIYGPFPRQTGDAKQRS